MKKYKPSVTNNDKLRDSVVTKLTALIYQIEKRKLASELDRDAVAEKVEQLKDRVGSLKDVLHCGNENIGSLANDALIQIKELKRQADQSMTHRFEEAADELIYTLGLWQDVLDEKVEMGTEIKVGMDTVAEIKKEGTSSRRKGLNARLDELAEIKRDFSENSNKLDKELSSFEKDLDEYNKAIMGEDDKRKLGNLVIRAKAIQKKIDMLAGRQKNYLACSELLGAIYANAEQILKDAKVSSKAFYNAKVWLNIEELKNAVVDPNTAMAVLSRMEAEVKAMAAHADSIANKLSKSEAEEGTPNAALDDALLYKEKLLREQREKEALANLDQSATITGASKTKIGTEE